MNCFTNYTYVSSTNWTPPPVNLGENVLAAARSGARRAPSCTRSAGPMGGGPGEAPVRIADAATGQRGAATPPVSRGATLRGQAPRGALGAIGTAAFLLLATQSACSSSWQL